MAHPGAQTPVGRKPRTVLILTADVGEGHAAVGRAIGEGLEALGVRPMICDGLEALGRLPRHLMRDGYRVQLRVAPGMYSAMYWVGAHVAPVRIVGAWLLSVSGGRRMRRLVGRHRPDVIVSTHPAITCVLSRMRLRRQLATPVCAAIPDLAHFSLWSHRGADLHLVAHPCAIERVERFAGAASAADAGPLVSRRFHEVGDRAEARRALDLHADGRLVVVSGGGWGVGDLEGAAEEALAAGAGEVVVLTGRNVPVRSALARRFAADRRVRVWGFTDRMPELLRAADALVHSTGGMTSFEAMASGCPLVAYGSVAGHIRVHNRSLAELGLADVPKTREELRAALAARLRAPRDERAALRPGGDAASVVASLSARVRPLPAWRIAGERSVAALACAAALVTGFATVDRDSVAARTTAREPGTRIVTTPTALPARPSASRTRATIHRTQGRRQAGHVR